MEQKWFSEFLIDIIRLQSVKGLLNRVVGSPEALMVFEVLVYPLPFVMLLSIGKVHVEYPQTSEPVRIHKAMDLSTPAFSYKLDLYMIFSKTYNYNCFLIGNYLYRMALSFG